MLGPDQRLGVAGSRRQGDAPLQQRDVGVDVQGAVDAGERELLCQRAPVQLVLAFVEPLLLGDGADRSRVVRSRPIERERRHRLVARPFSMERRLRMELPALEVPNQHLEHFVAAFG